MARDHQDRAAEDGPRAKKAVVGETDESDVTLSLVLQGVESILGQKA
jgi:hypothetical protein